MPTPLLSPRYGAVTLIDTEVEFAHVVDQIISGAGPVAIDAERASGFRYSQRAYLIQIFRRGGGLHLIDPIPLTHSPHIARLNNALRDEEWVIHASTQDLPCLREFGISPQRLFDTELGGRLAGCERVGLGPLTESLLELTLAKEHSAVDWSFRPLHHEWLIYAALDVDVLLDLRDAVEKLLEAQGKLEWAKADFASILTAPPPTPRKDPWRRTSGVHTVRDRRALAIVRELWSKRDEIAREIDIAPGRLLNDSLIVALSLAQPKTMSDFISIPQFARIKNELQRSYFEEWLNVLTQVDLLPPTELPELRSKSDGMPPTKIWRDKFSDAYARFTHARAALTARAIELGMPVENLISPDSYKRICWLSQSEPTLIGNEENVSQRLAEFGARPWQIAQVAPLLASALCESEPIELPEPAKTEENQPLSE